MKKPLRSYILVKALLDENDVPYLVADARATSRRVGVERVHPPPKDPDHFAEHFKPRAHPVDVTDVLHLAHYRMEEAAKTIRIIGPVQAADAELAAPMLAKLEAEQLQELAPEPAALEPTPSTPDPAAAAPRSE